MRRSDRGTIRHGCRLLLVCVLLCAACGSKESDLIRSCERGDVERAARLLDEGVSVNATRSDGAVPLEAACFNGRKEIVELLIRHGADVDSRFGNGTTPLILAGLNRHWDLAEMLISMGADVNGRTADGRTPLHWAAGKTSEAAFIHPAHCRDMRRTVLQFTRFLLANGADVNSTVNGLTVVDIAALTDDGALVSLLLSHGGEFTDSAPEAAKRHHDNELRLMLMRAASKRRAVRE